MKEKTITIRPYDYDAQQRVFALLFHGSGISREDGLTEIPAASYQLVISALELIKWEVSCWDNDTIGKAIAIVEDLRDQQKIREYRRNNP